MIKIVIDYGKCYKGIKKVVLVEDNWRGINLDNCLGKVFFGGNFVEI